MDSERGKQLEGREKQLNLAVNPPCIGGSKMKKQAKAVAKKAAEVKMDKYGFREGSHVSKLFAALVKGATIPDLKKIAGAATYKTIAEFRKGVSENPRGRKAKVEVSDKNVWKLVSFKVPAAK